MHFPFLLAAICVVFSIPGIEGVDRVVCYYSSGAAHGVGLGQFLVTDLDPNLCTHFVYAFVGLGSDSQVRILDPKLDLEENGGMGYMKKFTSLKNENPELRTMLAIGGWGEGSTNYSNMVSSAENRQTFIQSIISLLESQNFDGLDVDWEYPTERGGQQEDRENFDLLLSELREEFDPRGWILSIALGGNIGDIRIQKCYNVDNLVRVLDFINVMTYDYQLAENGYGYAHHHSPLYGDTQDAAHEFYDYNTDHTLMYLLELGAPAEKLNLGLGCYGRGVTLEDPNQNGIYAPASGPIYPGPINKGAGYWGYHEICATVGPNNWTTVRLEGGITSPYSYDGVNWIGYEDPESIVVKTQYAKEQGFGVFTWSVDTDDFRGSCHDETFPLVRAMRRTIADEH